MIVVFGAGGFIGTYLVDQLRRDGKEVIASDISAIAGEYYAKQGVEVIPVDITRREEFDRLPTTGIDAVIHLACVQPANVSERAYDAADYVRVNVLGTLNVLEYCRVNKVPKVIYTCSHRNTQGMWQEKDGTAIRESDGRAIKYAGDYAMFSISESAAADCVEHYSQAYGLEGVIFRLPPVYGYGPHTVIFKDGQPMKTGFQVFIERATRSEPLELWGDLESGRDIVYVKDVVHAFQLALAKSGVGGLYNISSGRRLTLLDQAESIVRVFSPADHPSELVRLPDKPNSVESYFYDIEKAKRFLGWQPQYSFADMLVDYQKELQSGRFEYLVEKRQVQMRNAARG